MVFQKKKKKDITTLQLNIKKRSMTHDKYTIWARCSGAAAEITQRSAYNDEKKLHVHYCYVLLVYLDAGLGGLAGTTGLEDVGNGGGG